MRICKTSILLALCIFITIPQCVHATSIPNIEAQTSSPIVNYDNKQDYIPASSRPLKLKDLRKKYPNTFKFQGPHVQQIALTFDDVPDSRFTPKVLDQLKRQGVKATFFVVGHRAKKHPDLIRRIHAEGHVIGNHSYHILSSRDEQPNNLKLKLKKRRTLLKTLSATALS